MATLVINIRRNLNVLMKTIFFIRHAKSSWEDLSLSDKNRPLNPRGLRDAPFMAKLLKGKLGSIDQIISSPANRAFTTAGYFAEAFDINEKKIQVEKKIYEAYTGDIFDIIKELKEEWNKVLLFGHNPSFTSIANRFSKEYIPNIPTCGIFEVQLSVQNWEDFTEDKGELVNFYYPKQYFS